MPGRDSGWRCCLVLCGRFADCWCLGPTACACVVGLFACFLFVSFLLFALGPALAELSAHGELQSGARCTVYTAGISRPYTASVLYNNEIAVQACLSSGTCTNVTAHRYATNYPWDTEDHAREYAQSLILGSTRACWYRTASPLDGVAMTNDQPGALWGWLSAGIVVPGLILLGAGYMVLPRIREWCMHGTCD